MWPFKSNRKVEGLIAFYHLEDWWLSAFNEKERVLIDDKYRPMGARPHQLTQGKISSSQPAPEFLNVLATWFRSPNDTSIAQRIRVKIDELGRKAPISKPGYYKGRHFTTYVADVEGLRREGSTDEAEKLLLGLIVATESECAVEKLGVAPWYYEELAKLYRKQKDYSKEIAILERFSAQQHAPGASPPKLLERLEKARKFASSKSVRDVEQQ